MMEKEEIGVGAELDIGFAVAQIGAKIDSLEQRWEKISDIVYQSPIYAQITGTTAGQYVNDGAATLNANMQNDLGTCWSVRRLSLVGYSAGTVTVYLNAIEPVAQWIFGTTTQPFNFYPKGGLLLQPGDRLTVGANAVTGTAQIYGVADTFPYWYLRRYLD